MGIILELEESDFAGYIEDGEVYNATVRAIRQRETKLVDERTNEKVQRIEFTFKLIADPITIRRMTGSRIPPNRALLK